jgi:hypothetical protein
MKRIGFDHVDPTPKPETSFHAPLLPQLVQGWGFFLVSLALMFHESPATTADSAVLPGVLRCRSLRRTIQVRLGTNPAVARDGYQVARPSSRSRDSNS